MGELGSSHVIEPPDPCRNNVRKQDTCCDRDERPSIPTIPPAGTSSSIRRARRSCRARRIDVWVEVDTNHIDSALPGGATYPEHGRIAVHEYVLRPTADRSTEMLRGIDHGLACARSSSSARARS